MSSHRVIFFSWGNGSGHITRLVDLADRAQAEGWDVMIATLSNPLHLDLIRKSGHAFTSYPDHLVPADFWECWRDSGFLGESISWDRELIGSVKPDIVIHDSRVPTMIAAAESNAKYASICQHTQLPDFDYPRLGTEAKWAALAPAINERLRKSKLRPVEGDIRGLFKRGRILVPSIPEIDVIPETLAASDIVHVGPLRVRPAARPRARRPPGDLGGRDVFFYRTVGPCTDWAEFAGAFGDIADRVHIATGNPAITARLQETLVDYPFHVATFLDVDGLRPRLGAAVMHGGHGITLACVALALPAVVLPGNNPERNLNGSRLAANGFGRVLGIDTSFATRWGDSVDVTGYVPAWQTVRNTVDALLATGLAPRARAISSRVTAESDTATFAAMLGLEHA
jgi:UDP:flavonoid glycosyltransferase YjiC (YdhE family)